MSEPRTKAGRALLAREALNGRSFGLIRVDDVLAIEAEATAGHAECEANMDAEIERLTLALASKTPPGVEEQRDQAWRNLDTAHEDIAAMLRASGLGDYARPISTHDVIQRELLPWIERQAASEPRETALREALQQVIGLLDRLDAQARDGGGARHEVYLSVEAWNEAFVPLRAQALAALADNPASEPRP